MKSVKYYDSLMVESEAGYLAADLMLTKLKQQGLEHMSWLPDSFPHVSCSCSRTFGVWLLCGLVDGGRDQAAHGPGPMVQRLGEAE